MVQRDTPLYLMMSDTPALRRPRGPRVDYRSRFIEHIEDCEPGPSNWKFQEENKPTTPSTQTQGFQPDISASASPHYPNPSGNKVVPSSHRQSEDHIPGHAHFSEEAAKGRPQNPNRPLTLYSPPRPPSPYPSRPVTPFPYFPPKPFPPHHSHTRLHSYPFPDESNNRNSTGSSGITSAIKSLFQTKKKYKGKEREHSVDYPASPRIEKPLSPFQRLSNSISQAKFIKHKVRSSSDPAVGKTGGEGEAPNVQQLFPLSISQPFPHELFPATRCCFPGTPNTSTTRLTTAPEDFNSTVSQIQNSTDAFQKVLLPPPSAVNLAEPSPTYAGFKTRVARSPTATMDPPRASRFLDPTSAMAAITKHKAEAMKLAREQGVAVQEMCRRAKTDAPPYEFEELIGKGSYGRVYKGHQRPSGKVVAIKVLDIDSLDYKSVRDFRDESIKDFIHETKVMTQVKDAGAKNINELIEAISIHSQLWLVCEYCPGGSVRTLMRATGDRLEEKFLIPVARELAAGLRAIHNAGIIHRDIKAANTLIHEEGRLEICDFGVAGVLQSQLDKRSTWIGTPHWMPPEMFATRGEAHKYGSEIDVWAYGCTLYEMATGNPPNANLRERMQIGRQLNRNAPKLDNDRYSEGLRSLVAFALESDPFTRPTMDDIIKHPYIADSKEAYPTSSLSELVRIYYQWSQRGGQRISLFHPGGAAAAEMPGTSPEAEEDWNFSTTDGFERRFSVIDLDQIAASLAEMEQDISPTKAQADQDSDEPAATAMTREEQVNFDERVRRGAEAMEGLFNEEKPSYTYETKNDFIPVEEKQPVSDLPLRTETDRSSVTSTFIDIDIGSFDSSHYAAGASSIQPFQLADADTIRANRSSGRQHRNSIESRSRSSSSDISSQNDSQEASFQPPPSGPRPPTMDWKFPVFMQAPEEQAEEEAEAAETVSELKSEAKADTDAEVTPDQAVVDPDVTARRATMEWTFPVMTAQAANQQTKDSDADTGRYDTLRAPVIELQPSATIRPSSIGEPGDSRPSTSTSAKSSISISSDTDYDPFRFDRPTSPGGTSTHQQPFYNNDFPEIMQSADDSDYERSSVMDGPGPDEEDSQPVWNEGTPDSTSQSEPFPTAIPSHELHLNPPFGTSDESPMSEPLPTARRDPPLTARRGVEPVRFPDFAPPRPEVLMEGAEEGAVTSELDRLLNDFLEALTSTGDALSRVHINTEALRNDDVTPERQQ